ncbi:MAG TPA: hypothetical protein VGH19_08330 [Verrucomicrobiae bacterium]
MIDLHIPSIEAISAEGAVVIIKWDGERTSKRCTVLITHHRTNYARRQDTDDLSTALQLALTDYRTHHPLT